MVLCKSFHKVHEPKWAVLKVSQAAYKPFMNIVMCNNKQIYTELNLHQEVMHKWALQIVCEPSQSVCKSEQTVFAKYRTCACTYVMYIPTYIHTHMHANAHTPTHM